MCTCCFFLASRLTTAHLDYIRIANNTLFNIIFIIQNTMKLITIMKWSILESISIINLTGIKILTLAVKFKCGELIECLPSFHVKHTHLLGGLWAYTTKILQIYLLEIKSESTFTEKYGYIRLANDLIYPLDQSLHDNKYLKLFNINIHNSLKGDLKLLHILRKCRL